MISSTTKAIVARMMENMASLPWRFLDRTARIRAITEQISPNIVEMFHMIMGLMRVRIKLRIDPSLYHFGGGIG